MRKERWAWFASHALVAILHHTTPPYYCPRSVHCAMQIHCKYKYDLSAADITHLHWLNTLAGSRLRMKIHELCPLERITLATHLPRPRCLTTTASGFESPSRLSLNHPPSFLGIDAGLARLSSFLSMVSLVQYPRVNLRMTPIWLTSQRQQMYACAMS